MAEGKKKNKNVQSGQKKSEDKVLDKKISRRAAISATGKAAIGVAVVAVAAGGIVAYIESQPGKVSTVTSTNTVTVTPTGPASSTQTSTLTSAQTTSTIASISGAGIPIGFVAALTGAGYGEGQPMLIGARIAQDFINNPALVTNPTATTTAGGGGILGQPINLIVSDEQSDPQTGLEVVQRMVEENGIVALTGENYSFVTTAYIGYINQTGIPFVNSGANSSTLRELMYPNVFFVEVPSCAGSVPAYQLITQLYKQGSVHNVAIIYSSDELGVLIENTIETNLKAAGVPFQSSEVSLTQEDFTSILLGFMGASPRPDMLVVNITGAGALVIPGQAASVGFAPTTATPWCFEPGAQFGNTENVWQTTGPNLLGWLTTLYWEPPAVLPLTVLGNAVNAYSQAQYGLAGIEGIYDGFDGVWSLANAINTAGTTESKAVVAALASQNIQGTRGQLNYPSTGPAVGTDDCAFQNVPANPCVCQFTQLNQLSTVFPVVFPAADATGTLQSTLAVVNSPSSKQTASTSSTSA
jgi:branched-chain amino acid transport system substrate-binding protein